MSWQLCEFEARLDLITRNQIQYDPVSLASLPGAPSTLRGPEPDGLGLGQEKDALVQHERILHTP